jgi:hypothetical protein
MSNSMQRWQAPSNKRFESLRKNVLTIANGQQDKVSLFAAEEKKGESRGRQD